MNSRGVRSLLTFLRARPRRTRGVGSTRAAEAVGPARPGTVTTRRGAATMTAMSEAGPMVPPREPAREEFNRFMERQTSQTESSSSHRFMEHQSVTQQEFNRFMERQASPESSSSHRFMERQISQPESSPSHRFMELQSATQSRHDLRPPTHDLRTAPEPACEEFNRFIDRQPPPPVCNGNGVAVNSNLGFYKRSLPQHLIDFSSSQGKIMFGEALAQGHMESYFKLAGQYHAQGEPAFCALAVLCMVLNSLSIDPARIWKSPWRWYSEEMMGCCTPLEEVKRIGIDFDKFRCLATCKGANVVALRHNETNLEEFRNDIKNVTSSADEFLVVSYNRKHVGQTGTGHFAPVAGYHAATDMVLLLDVARFKYPPHWVSVPLLFDAMQDIDPETNKSRGYYLLSGTVQPTPDASLNKKRRQQQPPVKMHAHSDI